MLACARSNGGGGALLLGDHGAMDHATDRSARPDELRILATLAVIMIHVSAAPVQGFGVLSPLNWAIGCAYASPVRCAVPLFFMLSGILLIPKAQDPWTFLQRRMSRVLVPFLVWSLVYLMVPASGGVGDWPQRSLHALLYGASYHLWFVYTLIGAYLAMPIIGPWARSAGTGGTRYFLVVWGLALTLGATRWRPLLDRMELGLFMGYLGYAVLGYHLSQLPVDQRRWRWWGAVLSIAGMGATAAGTYWVSAQQGRFVEDLFRYLSPNVAIASVGVMMLWRADALPTLDRWPAARRAMAECSYGVYLVHVLVLLGLVRVGLDWRTLHPLLGIPITTLACFLLSMAFVRAVRSLPFGDKLVG